MIRGHKQKNKAFFANLKNPTNGRQAKAVPIIILNGKKEVALIMQDNAPVWRVFGNGFFDDSSRKYDSKGKYYHHAKRILYRETNLPYKLIAKMKPILRYDAFYSDTKVRFEGNRVFVLNIGNFPIESRKGAFVAFFNMDARPNNMNSNHGLLFDLAAKQVRYGHGRELFTALSGILFKHNNPHMAVLEDVIKTSSTVTGLEQWKNHPKVVTKRAAGSLVFDP